MAQSEGQPALPAPAPAGPDAAGGGGAAPSGREGFRFRVSGIGALQEADISRHFGRYGEVLGIDFATDARTGQPAGKASVRLCGFDGNAKTSIFNDSHVVNGYTLTITDDCERKLFIGGFKDTPAEVVRDHFALFGEMEEFDAAVRDQNGKPRGYAFARFVRAEDLDRVLAQPEHQINGRTVTVRKAEARPVPMPKGDGEGGGKKRTRTRQRSVSCSSSEGRRRARGGGRGRGGKGCGGGGLQVAPGYEYKDGVGAQPSMGYYRPGDRGYTWGPPPPHPYYGYPPPAYGAPPPPGYGASPPPAYGYPGYPPPAGYGPPQGWPPPPQGSGYPGGPGGAGPGYDPAAYQAPPPGGYYGQPPGGYGPPPSHPGYGGAGPAPGY